MLATIPPGEDVNTEGDGDILRIIGEPQVGQRTIQQDPDTHLLTAQQIATFPQSYNVEQYGYHPNEVALTFDDGPDPAWTPKILDILKQKQVVGTFMVIGEEAQDNIGLLKRYYRDGQEIGNHTWTHPDISEISNRQLSLELNLTERLFAAELGVQPLYFRPPYSIDQEPDTNDQAAPADRIQQMGYTIIGDKIDTSDWDEHPRKTPQEIVDTVLDQLRIMKTKPQFRGSIILLHDGGGDRSVTVESLPVLIDALRAHGYKIVPVSALIGKTRAQVMPPIAPQQRWQARMDAVAFFIIAFFNHTVILVFFVGDVLMTGRLVIVGLFAAIDRFRRRRLPARRGDLSSAGCGADSCIQRREGDCAHDSLRAALELSEPARDRDRRWLDRQHAGSSARGSAGGSGVRSADGADQAERRQGRGAQFRAGAGVARKFTSALMRIR